MAGDGMDTDLRDLPVSPGGPHRLWLWTAFAKLRKVMLLFYIEPVPFMRASVKGLDHNL